MLEKMLRRRPSKVDVPVKVSQAISERGVVWGSEKKGR